jgi:predicted permease
VLFFVGCSLIGGTALGLGTWIWGERSPHAHILAFACGSGNTGYFGLPLIAAVLGAVRAETSLAVAIFGIMGFVLYENTLGFYFAARSRHPAAESLRRVLRLPAVYAFALGVILNLAHVEIGGAWRELALSYRGAYTVFGMMLVGVGLGQARIEREIRCACL